MPKKLLILILFRGINTKNDSLAHKTCNLSPQSEWSSKDKYFDMLTKNGLVQVREVNGLKSVFIPMIQKGTLFNPINDKIKVEDNKIIVLNAEQNFQPQFINIPKTAVQSQPQAFSQEIISPKNIVGQKDSKCQIKKNLNDLIKSSSIVNEAKQKFRVMLKKKDSIEESNIQDEKKEEDNHEDLNYLVTGLEKVFLIFQCFK